MRGFPLINAFVIALALGLILVPLVRLTSRSAAAPSGVEAPGDTGSASGPVAIPVSVSLRYTHLPESLTLTHLDEVLWRADTADALEDGSEILLRIPEEGVDLVADVVWPEETPLSAIEITLEPDALEERVAVLWGEGRTDDVLSFVWGEVDS